MLMKAGVWHVADGHPGVGGLVVGPLSPRVFGLGLALRAWNIHRAQINRPWLGAAARKQERPRPDPLPRVTSPGGSRSWASGRGEGDSQPLMKVRDAVD